MKWTLKPSVRASELEILQNTSPLSRSIHLCPNKLLKWHVGSLWRSKSKSLVSVARQVNSNSRSGGEFSGQTGCLHYKPPAFCLIALQERALHTDLSTSRGNFSGTRNRWVMEPSLLSQSGLQQFAYTGTIRGHSSLTCEHPLVFSAAASIIGQTD